MIKKSSTNDSHSIPEINSNHTNESVKPLRADARRNRERVLEAANIVFASEGVSVQMDEIASRAGVGVGTIYRHFPTKESLFEAVIFDHKQQLVEEAKSLLDHVDAGEAFFGFLSHMIKVAIVNKALSDDLAVSGYNLGCEGSEITQELQQAFNKLLEKAQQSGSVRSDVRISDLQALVSGVLLAKNHYEGDTNIPVRIMNVIIDGLRGHQTPN